MAVKEETAHWQLRSLIGASESNTVYYPTGTGNLHIQEFDTVTRRSETVALLSFSPRCLVAHGGWLCCGGEEGEFIAIRSGERSRTGRSGRSSSQADPGLGAIGTRGGEGNRGNPINSNSNSNSDSNGDDDDDGMGMATDDANRAPDMEDEEYDAFDLRMGEAAPSLVTVPSRLVSKSQKFGTERVNCITVWTPPTFVPPCPGAYTCPVAVLANNDKHVTLVNLEAPEALDDLEFPDCVNRAVLSPDGRLLATVSDDPYLYLHERVEKPEPVGSRLCLSRFGNNGNGGSSGISNGISNGMSSGPRKQYEWRLLTRHHLRGQRKNDLTVHRGSFAACFSNTGKYLAVGTQYGMISVLDTNALGEPGEGLVACFASSNPNVDSGAVREMAFCPGPYDLLAWSEDHGAVGVADVRNRFVSRQILRLCDDAAYEHVAINQIVHTDDEFVEERQQQRRRRQQQQQHQQQQQQQQHQQHRQRQRQQPESPSPDESGGSGRPTVAGIRLAAFGDASEYTLGEQALRIRDALDRYHMPLTADETQLLDALQARRRRREREQRDTLTREQREERDRREGERIQEYLGRRSAWMLRSRSSLGSGSPEDNDTNNDNSNNNNGGSSSAARSRERTESLTVPMNDVLASLRSLRNAQEAGDLERRRLGAATPSLLRAASRPSAAIPTVENEESGSNDDGGDNNNDDDDDNNNNNAGDGDGDDGDDDDDAFSARTFTQGAGPPSRRRRRLQRQQQLQQLQQQERQQQQQRRQLQLQLQLGQQVWGGGFDAGAEPGAGGAAGENTSNSNSNSNNGRLDLLRTYTGAAIGGRSSNAAGPAAPTSTSARRGGAVFTDALWGSGSNTLMDWDSGLGGSVNRRAREPGPSEQKDGHTAGLAWSDDGSILYIGTEGGIYEFRVNVKGRRFYPSVTMR
ncbi:l-2-hydroxyglutarate mitochondrial precursor [Niveomyces insectorum RCEF 264]|uniref:L-2-hydroxyglutarate mitochondrial n=1 Tax=Niveomyces insectorum RCEF 264 TaxID=1081102 RepID=A0A167PFS2_9HYPO|nr:l-2-hydroxyglutarate mitochondrial precursor [Niveomyces insectorum RCEF 264]